MNKTDILITLLGWEERFMQGIKKTVESSNPKKMVLFYCQEYETCTKEIRKSLQQLCKSNSIELIEEKFPYRDPVTAWENIKSCLISNVGKGANCLVDLTTMPRGTIWTTFHFLDALGANTHYVYYPPEEYCNDWLSRNSMLPRLIYKHSGIFSFSRNNALLIATGFDLERTEQLIAYFEPEESILIFQEGDRFSNKKFNVDRHKSSLGASNNIKEVTVDFYSDNHGLPLIEQEFLKSKDQYNWIFCSLGPKPSAVVLYQIHSKYPETALSYVPSTEYSLDYSKGIGEEIYGSLR